MYALAHENTVRTTVTTTFGIIGPIIGRNAGGWLDCRQEVVTISVLEDIDSENAVIRVSNIKEIVNPDVAAIGGLWLEMNMVSMSWDS